MWGSPPTQNCGLLHPGSGSRDSGRGKFFSEQMEVFSTDVAGDQGKSPPLWTLPPEGEPTPWTALGIRGEGGTGGGGGTTWLSHDPPPPAMSAPGPGRLSTGLSCKIGNIPVPGTSENQNCQFYEIHHFSLIFTFLYYIVTLTHIRQSYCSDNQHVVAYQWKSMSQGQTEKCTACLARKKYFFCKDKV